MTRSFSSGSTERTVREQAVAAHATRLGEKLRRDGLAVSAVTVFYPPASTTAATRCARSRRWCICRRRRTTAAPDSGGAPRGREDLEGAGPTPWRYSKAGLVTKDLVPLDGAPARCSARSTGEDRCADGCDGCLTSRSAWLPWCRRGPGRREAHLVDEVRDALAAVHDAVERGADGQCSLTVIAQCIIGFHRR